MADIVLSAGVRQNLLALQSTADLMSQTQNRLATGKKINSALDNPGSFFTSQALSNRASDLNALLDSIGQAQQVLKAADTGISSLTKLVESAKSIAKQAQQAPAAESSAYNAFAVTSDPMDETLGTFTTAVFGGPTVLETDGIGLSVTIGGNNYNVNLADQSGLAIGVVATNLQAAIDSAIGAGRISVSESGGELTIEALNADVDFTILANDTTAELGLTTTNVADRVVNSTSLLDNIATSGHTLTVQVNGGANQVITFGNGMGEVSTLAELNTALASLTGGVTATANGSEIAFNVASSSSQNSLLVTSSDPALETALGLANGPVTQGTQQVGAPNTTRTSLESDFNNVLSQIDTLVRDSSYNGINLLNGDDFKVVFNETGSSFLTIGGVTFDANGLGLAAVGTGHFQDNGNIDAELAKLDTALAELRNQASKFGSTLTTVQIRQDFTKNLINTLQTGADNLVLADTNAEGANLLALQTRQQLSTTALSLSAQADQAVLRLFG